MTAFFVAQVAVKDPAKFQEYAEKAGATFKEFGGQPVLRGKAADALVGELTHQACGIIQFPTLAKLNAWFQSDIYQALVPLREEAADMQIITYEVPV